MKNGSNLKWAALLAAAILAAAATSLRADEPAVNPSVTNVVTVLVTNVVTVTVTNVVSITKTETPPPTEVKPKSAWDVTAAAGLTLTKGNSDTALFTASILAEKKKGTYELSLGADGSYGENSGVKNNESYHGFGQYNHLFTDRFFAYGRVDGLHDGIADVEYRITLSPGVGYYFVKNATTSLSGEAGPGYVFEREGGESRCYPSLRIAEKFEHKVNDHMKIWESLEFLPKVEDFNKYVVNAEIGVEAAMTKKSSLRVYLDDTYDSQPASGRKNNDVKLVSALAYKF